MKKILTLFLVTAMVVSLASCGNKEKKSSLVGSGTIGGTDEVTDIKITDEESKGVDESEKDIQEDKKADISSEKESEASVENEKNQESSDDSNNTENEVSEEEEEVTPTFMYFVSKKDKGYDKTIKMLDELKKKYGERVNFNIVDIDENPDAVNNFQMVNGNTPYLIMLNTTNDICALKPKISDEKTLTQEIENALR